MKILYLFIACFLFSAYVSAQCVIDSTNVPQPGVYPAAANLAHIQQGVAYDETIQGRIQSSKDTTIGGFIMVHIRVDSVRIDSITGMPNGITWSKNPNVLYGGRPGCVRFTGTTNDGAGQYDLTAWGVAWTRAQSGAPFPIDTPYVITGNLNDYSPFGGYYLTVDGSNVLAVTTSTTSVYCFGGTNGSATANPTGGSNYTYLWSNGGTTQTIQVAAGTYTVTVISGLSSATASAVVTQPAAALSASAVGTPSTGSNGTATASATGGTPNYGYLWNTGATTATISGLAPGTYTVTVVDGKDCSASATTAVVMGIEETAFDAEVKILPNPANSQLNISTEFYGGRQLTLKVVTLSGQVVYTSQQAAAGKFNTSMDCSQLAQGVYVLEMATEKQVVRKRFVIAR